jgi:hypothetical protein
MVLTNLLRPYLLRDRRYTSRHHIYLKSIITDGNGVVQYFRAVEDWGVDALVGLDFFKQFRVTIDYKAGQIITEPFIV